MTDKQMEEKKQEFTEKFSTVTSSANGGFEIHITNEVDELWQWIEKLVEEVEREQFDKATFMAEPDQRCVLCKHRLSLHERVQKDLYACPKETN